MSEEKALPQLPAVSSIGHHPAIPMNLEDAKHSEQCEKIHDSSPSWFIVNDPTTLLCLTKEIASSKYSRTATITRSAPSTPNAVSDCSQTANATIQMLRVKLFACITPGELTPTELNGGVDGPTMAPLIQLWREAFRSIPDLHSIKRVQFDLSCRERLELRHIVRFLQEISTVMHLKAKRDMGRELEFEVVGCDESVKTWLETSLPGATCG